MVFLSPGDARWESFISTHQQACIFHHPAWVNCLAKSYKYHPYILALTGSHGRIEAGLPMLQIIRPFTSRRSVSLPFSDHCAPLFDNRQDLDLLLDEFTKANEGIPNKIEIRWNYSTNPLYTTATHFVLHNISLCPDFPQVASSIHSMHTRNARAAQKRGVRVELKNDLRSVRIFYDLHTRTRRFQGVPVQPWDFFELIFSDIIDKGLGFVILAYHENKCLAGAVFLHWQSTLTYKYGASSRESLNLRPNDLIFWTAIQWGCEHGFTSLDLGRTDLENHGLREYKSRWGAVEIPLTYSYLPGDSKTSALNKLMPVLNQVIRHSPLFLCRLAGKMLYGYFG